MTKLMMSLILGTGILCTLPQANARESKEHISREFTVSKDGTGSTLFIYNISGFIKVEGYAGDKILFEIDKTISADDDKSLETGKKEFKLGFDQRSDSVIAYIAEPYDSRPHKHWHYDNDREDVDYNFNVDFTVKVPFGISLNISTVNDGIVEVNNVSGILHVNNVNEAISITNAKGTTYAHTVNGDVTVNYLTNPPDESSYYTINGNIRITYQKDLSADLQFKTMNGDFYTDFPDASVLPGTISKVQEKRDKGIVFKLNSYMAVRFGKGGKTFKLETLNGNVYIKKQS
jgi:hypothetical protein